MSDLIQLDEMPLETLTELAKESFEDCAEPLKMYLDNEQKLKRFGDILRACRAKVPHGKWYDWVQKTFSGQLSVRAVQLWISDAEDPRRRQIRNEQKAAKRLGANGPNAQPVAHLPEQPPATPAQQPQRATTETITEASTYHSVATQVAKPAWLADPDEMGLPTADDLPPLPRTNTHHTADNRRQPDARDTDRAGIVPPQDPRELQDGKLYIWRESANRLFPATLDEIWEAAKDAIPEKLVTYSESPTPEPRDTKKVAERERDTKRFIKPTVAEVAAYAKEIGAAIDAEQFCDFYTAKDWMIGKNKMKDWKAAVRTWKRGQVAKPGTIENGKVRSANWEDDGTGWEDLRDG